MKIEKVILASVIGTTAMTLFSIAVSEAKDRNFKEPEVLASLIKSFHPAINKKESLITGWTLHYILGIFFAFGLNEVFESKMARPDIKHTIPVGAISGLTGILLWYASFKLHPDPPSKNLKRYFGHLLIAHLVFTSFATIVFAEGFNKKKL